MKNNLFENLPDFPTLQIGGRKLVTKPDLIEWMQSHVNHDGR